MLGLELLLKERRFHLDVLKVQQPRTVTCLLRNESLLGVVQLEGQFYFDLVDEVVVVHFDLVLYFLFLLLYESLFLLLFSLLGKLIQRHVDLGGLLIELEKRVQLSNHLRLVQDGNLTQVKLNGFL